MGEISIENIDWIMSFIMSFTIVICVFWMFLSHGVIVVLVLGFLLPSGVNCVIFSLFFPFCIKVSIEVCVRCSVGFS